MSRTLTALLLGASLIGAMPVHAPARRISGLWEGVFHRARGDQPVAVVLRPRGASSFAGMVYLGGKEFGPIEEAHLRGDSLTFLATNYPFLGKLEGRTLSLVLVVPH